MAFARYLSTSADISADGLYRYSLSRRFSDGEDTVLFIGLNPSTADGATDDPTIRRCVGFARLWASNVLLMGNVYAFRAADPTRLMLAEDPVGPNNERRLKRMIGRADIVVAAWGGRHLNDSAARIADWGGSLANTRCLGQNQDGSPKHPLYVRGDTPLRKLRSRDR